jgi:hypothetical protein
VQRGVIDHLLIGPRVWRRQPAQPRADPRDREAASVRPFTTIEAIRMVRVASFACPLGSNFRAGRAQDALLAVAVVTGRQ